MQFLRSGLVLGHRQAVIDGIVGMWISPLFIPYRTTYFFRGICPVLGAGCHETVSSNQTHHLVDGNNNNLIAGICRNAILQIIYLS